MTNRMPLPRYHQIYLVLKERLAEQRYPAGFPGDFELMREFDAGRVTIRRALDALVSEGLIKRSPGKGTVVTPQAAQADPVGDGGQGLLNNLVRVSLESSVQVKNLEIVPATASVAHWLGIADGEQVQKVTRVRSTAAGPLSVIVTHVPLQVAPAFDTEQLSHKPLLTLLEEQGLELGQADQTISAKLADAEVATWLDIPVGAALIAVRRVMKDRNQRPIQLLNGLYRPDRYEYNMSLAPSGDVDARIWVNTPTAASAP